MKHKLLVVTACLAENDLQIEKLRYSCKKNGIDFGYYGIRVRYTNWKEAKVDQLIDYLRTDDHEIVMFTDGFDSFVMQDERTILDKFDDIRSPIVLSAERDYYPDIGLGNKFKKSETSFRYPCAGGFIGYRMNIINALELMRSRYMNYDLGGDNNKHKTNDQTLWQLAVIEDILPIKLDTCCEIFLNMNGIEDRELITFAFPFIFKETDSRPAVLHFNGPKGGSPMEKNMELIFNKYKEHK